MKILLTLLLLCFACSVSAQTGTYNLVSIPKGATIPKNSEGAFEYPIYIGTITIKLKLTRKAVVIHNEGEERERVLKGNWSKERELIKIELNSEDETIYLNTVEYESGTYLKRVDSTQHYMKK